MPASVIPRFDSSDPKRPEAVRTFKLKPSADNFSVFSSGGGMMLGAMAMFTRQPLFAFLAFAVSLLGMLNGPDVAASDNSFSPWTSVMMSTTALANVYLPKILPNPALEAAARAAAASAASN